MQGDFATPGEIARGGIARRATPGRSSRGVPPEGPVCERPAGRIAQGPRCERADWDDDCLGGYELRAITGGRATREFLKV